MSAPPSENAGGNPPLCVDLDGTLLKTDLLWESLVARLRRNPLALLLVPFWWARGRACLKDQLARRAEIDFAVLPHSVEFVAWLRQQKKTGRRLILATASDQKLAQRVADEFQLFDKVVGSDGRNNLRGHRKAQVLTDRFGRKGFDYAGNSSVDLPVWSASRRAVVVNARASVAARAQNLVQVERMFPSARSWPATVLQSLRPHQWVKNLIIFVPLLTAHELGQFSLLLNATVAFLAFSLCASSGYVLNDLLDIESDRHHNGKRRRPFASGDLGIAIGLVMTPVLLATSLALGAALAWRFAAVLLVYFGFAAVYSWRAKRVPLLDVFFLAGLYTWRLIAGQEATGIRLSAWLLMFSMFIFLSLALVKRYTELAAARERSEPAAKGRGYLSGDVEVVGVLGLVCGCLSALVLALYVTSQEVGLLYNRPALLLLLCPLLLYWVSRVWLLARRGQMYEDPVVFALKDPVSYVVGVFTLAVIWLAAKG